MKLVIGALLALVGVLSWRLIAEVKLTRELRSDIQGLSSKIADNSKRASLDLQAKCASQAEKVFRVMGYKENLQNGNFDFYQSHYNPALNKCFMTIQTTDINTTPGTMLVNRFLLDAYEQMEFGEYTWMSSKTKKAREVLPISCKLIPSSGNERFCNTEEEHLAFVARYME